MLVTLLLVSLTVNVNSQCLPSGGCGGATSGQSSYHMPYSQYATSVAQPLPAPLPQPIEYYYRSSSYDHHPASETLSNVDKEVATATVSTKSTEYDDYEKKLPELKQTTVVEHLPPIIETPTTPPPVTYVREITYQPYQSRPVAYRPQAFIPSSAGGCGPVSPQYYRPMPYMPRGYVMPYTPPSGYSGYMGPSSGYSGYSGYTGYQVAPPPPPLPPPPPPPQFPLVPPPRPYIRSNDCCGRCSSVCGGYPRRALARSAKTLDTASPTKKNGADEDDNRCSNKKLKDIMVKISFRNPSAAKRLIQRAAEEKLGGRFAVICSKDDFTYVSRSETYCQTENNGVVCYAFQHQ